MRTAYEVVGYDGTNEIYRTTIPTGCITPAALRTLLQLLVAMNSLTNEEATRSLLKRRTKACLQHLDVQASNDGVRRGTVLTCGSNPYFVARTIMID